MEIMICLLLVFFWILPGLAWLVFQAIVDIRKKLAETRYFNVTADCNEYFRAERCLDFMGWED